LAQIVPRRGPSGWPEYCDEQGKTLACPRNRDRAARETKNFWAAKMKMADFIIGVLVAIVAFLALIAHLGTAWSVVIALFAGASALLLSNAFRMTQGIR